MSKHYLVTGGAGFIGSHIVEALLKRGDKVRVLDDFSTGSKKNVPAGVEAVQASITDPKHIAPAFKGIDGVFHTAALPNVERSFEKPRETHDINLTGTLNIILAARDAGVKRLVYSSSGAVYGDQPTLPFNEDMPSLPKSPYALQKYVGEEYCKIASLAWGIETVSLRYFNVYGPGAAFTGAYANVIPIFLRQRAAGQPLTITGDGTQTRDYIYVDDVAQANCLAMESANAGKGEVVNIGSGKSLSVNGIAKHIGGLVVHIAPRIEPHDARADITRAKKLLNWAPKAPFEEGLARTTEWFDRMKNAE